MKLSFGSTGNFATQIREGAPFQMFMAADEKFIADLHRGRFTRDEGTLYAEGRIVMMVPHGSALKPDEALETWRAALDAGTSPLCHRQSRNTRPTAGAPKRR